MIPLIDDYQNVDVFTVDAELADLIFREYPERLMLDTQYHIDTSELGVEMYCFYDLAKGEITSFLAEYGQNYTYELRRSTNGDFVAVHQKA